MNGQVNRAAADNQPDEEHQRHQQRFGASFFSALTWVVRPRAAIAIASSTVSSVTSISTTAFGSRWKELNTATRINRTANHGMVILLFPRRWPGIIASRARRGTAGTAPASSRAAFLQSPPRFPRPDPPRGLPRQPEQPHASSTPYKCRRLPA